MDLTKETEAEITQASADSDRRPPVLGVAFLLLGGTVLTVAALDTAGLPGLGLALLVDGAVAWMVGEAWK